MKIMHISDLHLGKRIYGRSLLEDQREILIQMEDIIDREGVSAVMIAGDIYDKSVPSQEAVGLLDEFLNGLARRRQNVIICAGNHDSVERLSFGEKIFSGFGIHISPAYDGNVKYVDLDGTRVHVLPFIKPANVRAAFPEEAENIITYTDAMKTAIDHMDLSDGKNILCCHQFVMGASRTDSEEVTVGGLDHVDASVFQPFDYVALGHVHRPQNVGKGARYCGTPLKYSFSEENDEKSVTILEIREEITIRTVKLHPKKDMRTVRGTYEELTFRPNYERGNREDYIRAVLTDEMDIPQAMAKMRVIYPNILHLEYDNSRTRKESAAEKPEIISNKSPMDYLEQFYEEQNGRGLTEEQKETARSIMEEIWEGEK